MSRKGNGGKAKRGKRHRHRLKSSTLLPDGPAKIVVLRDRWQELVRRAEHAKMLYDAAVQENNAG